MSNEDAKIIEGANELESAETYERPQVVDFGSLQELTLSGAATLSDSFGGATGGGS